MTLLQTGKFKVRTVVGENDWGKQYNDTHKHKLKTIIEQSIVTTQMWKATKLSWSKRVTTLMGKSIRTADSDNIDGKIYHRTADGTTHGKIYHRTADSEMGKSIIQQQKTDSDNTDGKIYHRKDVTTRMGKSIIEQQINRCDNTDGKIYHRTADVTTWMGKYHRTDVTTEMGKSYHRTDVTTEMGKSYHRTDVTTRMGKSIIKEQIVTTQIGKAVQ
ncbi:hypothetical protein CHS0354_026538 [Potamilus streckersoni]|uniref:Uncharacterized protein n=1 Tax=Potamilus streckersoni TaxID=2493646 RepID=A0AAE0VGN1_9BIVA|nr:hypothetical protein CHS0354_026538 [Potamilus streckersoni]